MPQLGVQQRPPHQADDDGRQQHGQDEHARARTSMPRSCRSKKMRERRAERRPGWRRPARTRIGGVAGGLPEDRVGEELLVVAEADEVERSIRLVPVGRSEMRQAVEQREQREDEQVQDDGRDEQQDVSTLVQRMSARAPWPSSSLASARLRSPSRWTPTWRRPEGSPPRHAVGLVDAVPRTASMCAGCSAPGSPRA